MEHPLKQMNTKCTHQLSYLYTKVNLVLGTKCIKEIKTEKEN